MKLKQAPIVGERVIIRLIKLTDKEIYYDIGFKQMDEEAQYYTGSTTVFSQQQIENYVDQIVVDESRYDFLIYTLDEQLVGEVVINEIDTTNRSANFRIWLFSKQYFNGGYGTEATKLAIQFAFETLKLHRVELEVFDYNPRAKHVYEKVGFKQEGIKREALWIKEAYHDVITMAMLEKDYLSTNK